MQALINLQLCGPIQDAIIQFCLLIGSEERCQRSLSTPDLPKTVASAEGAVIFVEQSAVPRCQRKHPFIYEIFA